MKLLLVTKFLNIFCTSYYRPSSQLRKVTQVEGLAIVDTNWFLSCHNALDLSFLAFPIWPLIYYHRRQELKVKNFLNDSNYNSIVLLITIGYPLKLAAMAEKLRNPNSRAAHNFSIAG